MTIPHEAHYHYAASDMYQALSHFMFRTSPELAQALYEGDYYRDMCDILAELGFSSSEVESLTRNLAVDAFVQTNEDDLFHTIRKDYTHLFSNPKISVMTPYESRFLGYEEDKKGQDVPLGTIVVDISRIYKENGFSIPTTPQERSDHMGVELIFMQILQKNLGCMIEAGDSAKRQEIEETMKNFLDKHLSVWGISFFNAITEKAQEDVYRTIGAIGTAFLKKELQQT
ncbi:MAG: molecular chaperone TorD family protein [Eggerthellaceae bacterium]|nr:molecular chaperone TorD family protein [Eggerthellaceae bacterium]